MDFSFTDEQKMFRDTVYRYAKEEIAPLSEEADLKSEFSFEIWEKLGAMGLLGLPIPEEYGGQGADIVTCCLAGEALGHAGVDSGMTMSLGAHIYLCAMNIYYNGTEEQKKKYLPDLASGRWIGCMGLTEPEAGSDAAAIRTTAVKRGDKYILNGSKTFITNAPVSDVMVVYANLSKARKREGITAFILEKGQRGLSTGKPFHKMGHRASCTSEIFMEDVEVSKENCLGGEGNGWRMALESVEWDRSTLASPGIGSLLYSLELCAKHANTRIAFNRPIKEFQAIQHKIADIKICLEVCKLAVYRVAASKDNGIRLNPLQAAVTKLYMGDVGFERASDAVQIFGGYGLMHEYPVERYLRDAKLVSIGGGSSEVMKLILSRMLLNQ